MITKETIELFFPLLDGPSDEEVAKANDVLKAREVAIEKRNKAALVTCTSQYATGKGCGARHTIGKLEYVQTHNYVQPYGCTGGDYWRAGEGGWICPSCGHRNRLYASPEVEKLKKYFAKITDDHKDHW